MKKYKNPVKLPKFQVKHIISILSQTMDWGLGNLKIPSTWVESTGKDITVLVIDTGCPVTKRGDKYVVHPDLEGAILLDKCKSFIKSEGIEDLQGHGCVEPETLIQTSYNGIETIEQFYNNLKVQEISSLNINGNTDFTKEIHKLKIKTHTIDTNGQNNVNYISTVYKTYIDSEIINIELDGKINYKLTPWHKVPIYREGKNMFVRADELNINDGFLRPISPKELNIDFQCVNTSEYRECLNCGKKITYIRPRIQKHIQCKRCNKNKWKDGFFTQIINEDFAYLMGVIITDGYINMHGKYCIEISSNTDEILNKCSSISESLGYGKGFISHKKNSDRKILKINSKPLVMGMINSGILVKNKSYYQILPNIISKSPLNIIYAFLAGVIDGDGCISECNIRNKITTVSKRWAYQLSHLFNSLGINSRIDINHNIGFNKTPNIEFPWIYNCNFSKIPMDIIKNIAHPIKKIRAQKEISQSKPYKNIKRITKEHVQKYYYDFTVENDHTYIANGYFVSNTHCIGIIGARNNSIGCVGYAPDCNIVTYKGLDRDGSGGIKEITAALNYALEYLKPDVISMSLGSQYPDSKMHEVIKKLYQINIPIIAAGGNGGEAEGINYPGKYEEVITIGAYDKLNNIADFSAVGDDMDFAFPGVEIYSTYLNNGYAKLSGTSMATPACAGAVALLLAKHKKQERETGKNDCKTVDQIKEHLRKYSIDMGPTNKDKWYGWGIVDVSKMILNPENLDEPIEIVTPTINETRHKTKWQKIKDFIRLIFKKTS